MLGRQLLWIIWIKSLKDNIIHYKVYSKIISNLAGDIFAIEQDLLE